MENNKMNPTMIKSSALMFFLMTACATVASHTEYDAYKRIRMSAPGSDERLIAMANYAVKHPQGYWIKEIQPERENREDELWEVNKGTEEGLRRYLAFYPDGKYAEQARPRLAAVSTVTARRQTQAQRQAQTAVERRAESEEARRAWVSRAVTFWAKTLVGIRNYGSAISAVARYNPDFSRAFGANPAPVCNPNHCIKHYWQHYGVPVPGGTRIERELNLYLRAKLVASKVERIEVVLPNRGFSRWYELENRTMVEDTDPTMRQAAIEWALKKIEPAILEVARGVQAVDIVPEPIDPIVLPSATPATPTQPPAAPETKQAPESKQAPAQPTAPAQTTTQGGRDTSLDSLLEAASGTSAEQAPAAEVQASVAAPVEEAPAALVIPVGQRSFRYRDLRIVIFTASDEDTGEAYDGFYIERARN